jgi:hypothetical protein
MMPPTGAIGAAGGAIGPIIVGAPTGATVGWVGTVIAAPSPDVPVSELGAVTVVIGATPALPISYEPIGIPVRATPPAVSGAVDVAVEAVVVLPQAPDVPGTVGVPDVTAPIDVPIVVVVAVPIDVPADVDSPVIPPPSKTEVEPEIGVVGGAIIVHGDALPVMLVEPVMPVLVPNAPESRGLTPGVESSVEPMGIPVGATVPEVAPSGVVAPMLGMVVVAICANAIFGPSNTGIVSASNARRMSHLFHVDRIQPSARSGSRHTYERCGGSLVIPCGALSGFALKPSMNLEGVVT